MPIYEYHCTACGQPHEALQKITDDPLRTCPHCHQDALQKLVSASSFQLKGSGWYVTDFRDKKPTAGEPPAKPAEPSAATESNSSASTTTTSSASSSSSNGSKTGGEAA